MKKPKLTNAVSEYMSKIGTAGGIAGRGSHGNFTPEMGRAAVMARIVKMNQTPRKTAQAFKAEQVNDNT